MRRPSARFAARSRHASISIASAGQATSDRNGSRCGSRSPVAGQGQRALSARYARRAHRLGVMVGQLFLVLAHLRCRSCRRARRSRRTCRRRWHRLQRAPGFLPDNCIVASALCSSFSTPSTTLSSCRWSKWRVDPLELGRGVIVQRGGDVDLVTLDVICMTTPRGERPEEPDRGLRVGAMRCARQDARHWLVRRVRRQRSAVSSIVGSAEHAIPMRPARRNGS